MFDEPFGVRVVFAPEMDKLGKMVGTKDGPIPSEVVEVVHDDSNEEVEDEEGADNAKNALTSHYANGHGDPCDKRVKNQLAVSTANQVYF